MVKNKLLLLLALLMTAATGAWAQEPATTYTVNLNDGTKNPTTWTGKAGDATQFSALPLEGVTEGQTVTLKYSGTREVKSIKATSDAAPAEPAGNIVDLATLTADYELQDGDVLTGETTSYKVTIAAGATVTLDGVNISSSSYCIKCAGDATIILKDGSTNTLTGTGDSYPALLIGDANTTLTIQGSTGVLNVESGDYCAGIGGGFSNTNSTCGNIRIEGGVITAQGGNAGAGIGADCGEATCGDIIITGGTITAKGGNNAAGIGTGNRVTGQVVCGNITIANTVTKVTATKGNYAPYSIGAGSNGSCGTVTIGGTKYWENNAAVNGGDTYLATSPLIYDPAAPATPAIITVTINQSDWGRSNSFTKDGVTVSAGNIDSTIGNITGPGSFSTTLGNFTKIVVTAGNSTAYGMGWSGSGSSRTWAHTPASTVNFSGNFMSNGVGQTTIVCTIAPTN